MGGTPGDKDTHRGWNRASHGRGAWKELPPRTGHSALPGQDCAVCFVHIISFTVWQGRNHQHFYTGGTEEQRGEVAWPRSHSWEPTPGCLAKLQSGRVQIPVSALPQASCCSPRLSLPCCKVGLIHHTGVRSKVVVKPVLGLYGLVFNCSVYREHSQCEGGETNRLGCV